MLSFEVSIHISVVHINSVSCVRAQYDFRIYLCGLLKVSGPYAENDQWLLITFCRKFRNKFSKAMLSAVNIMYI